LDRRFCGDHDDSIRSIRRVAAIVGYLLPSAGIADRPVNDSAG